MIELSDWGDVERLIANRTPESPSLEYKRQIDLATDSQRAEVLKDLSGIGNGGGGLIVYGIAEDPANSELPGEVFPMTDRGLSGVLEDIVRSGIRPPLLMTLSLVEGADGFVLVADVHRSPLGPYMVETYGERRYFTRQGTRTVPMSEQQVRDAYALSARGREGRDELWDAFQLRGPPPTDNPWLTVVGLPEEPLADIFDPSAIQLDSLRPESVIEALRPHAEDADLSTALNYATIWAHGVYSDRFPRDDGPPTSMFRFYRNGAVFWSVERYQVISTWSTLRALNADLAFLGWLWKRFDPRTLVEVEARLDNLATAKVDDPSIFSTTGKREAKQPSHAPPARVILRREFVPSALGQASVRHSFVRDFSDRLQAAFNFQASPHMFTRGWLYNDQGFLSHSISGSGVWDVEGKQHASVDEGGVIRSISEGSVVGWFDEGLILSEEGDVVAALELATNAGLPDDFALQRVVADPRPKVPGGDPGVPGPVVDPSLPTPSATRKWAQQPLISRLHRDVF